MRKLPGIFIAASLVLFFLVAFFLGGPVSSINWSNTRAVALESDDWGLAGFVPQADLWPSLDRSVLKSGPSFPNVYWESTLEDSSMVAGLCAVLSKHQGNDGLPAVFQPNYVMSSLAWINTDGTGNWQHFDIPQFSGEYSRPGMWEAVNQGISKGVWYPEFHATYHYDPNLRLQKATVNSAALDITQTGILLFPGSEKARELGSWRDRAQLEAEMGHSLQVFANIFGRKPASIIAPDYTWNDGHEQMWSKNGLNIIQGKREQRNPDYGYSYFDRFRKVVNRRIAYVFRSSRTYLERNCRFEPVQRPDRHDSQAMANMVTETVSQTLTAWHRGQPAIVETHRVNFAHTDSSVVKFGQTQLDAYLGTLLETDEGKRAVFLVDTEIAQLYRSGTSVCLRGETIIIRNATHSRRIIEIPAEIIVFGNNKVISGLSPLIVLVGSGESLQVPLSEISP